MAGHCVVHELAYVCDGVGQYYYYYYYYEVAGTWFRCCAWGAARGADWGCRCAPQDPLL